MKSTRAYAHTNIAIIKYWGKIPGEQNLPSTGSLSLTLDRFGTETEATFADQPADSFVLNGVLQTGESLERAQHFLDVVRALAKRSERCHIQSTNHVPTKSGLASSASGFAALALATAHQFELELNPMDLSRLARLGSGSAARSIFGDFVLMHPVSPIDQSGGYAEQLHTHSTLDVKMIVVQCSKMQKAISSRTGMLHTQATSLYYPSWVSSHYTDLESAIEAIRRGDFKTLGELTEYSTLKMHATLLAAKPGYWYFDPLSLTVMSRVRTLRDQGASCYFTLDAGPHVKVLCPAHEAEALAKDLAQIPDVIAVDIASPGPGAYLL